MGSRPIGGGEGRVHPRGTAKDRALRLLGVRWRSREELRRRLRAAGFEADEVEAALSDLDAAGLIDDARFAQELVRDRAVRRMSGDRAIAATLRQRGVSPEIAGRALEGAGVEGERARMLASQRAERLAGVDPETAFRGLFGLLVRRGFSPGLAAEAAREALRGVLSPESAAEEPP